MVTHAVADCEEEEERLPEGCFSKLAGGDLIRDIRTAEDGAVDVEFVVNHTGD